MADIIIDNGDAEYSEAGSGWADYGGGAGIGGDSRYNGVGTGTDTATWDFGLLSGTYDVYVHYHVAGNRASDTPYTVKNHTGVVTLPTVADPIVSVADNIDEAGGGDANATTVDVNQEHLSTGGGAPDGTSSGYVYIGTYTFGGASNALVILTDNATDSAFQYIIADAAKFSEVISADPNVAILGLFDPELRIDGWF